MQDWRTHPYVGAVVPPTESTLLTVKLMRTVFTSRDVGVLARASAALQKQASAIARTRGIDLQRVAGTEVDDWAIVGEPERVADGIARYQETFGMTHLVVRSQIPGVERVQMLSSLELVASLQSGDVG